MAGPTVMAPPQGLASRPAIHGGTSGGTNQNQHRFSQPPPRVPAPHTDAGPRSEGPVSHSSFHPREPYKFRPRFPPNRNQGDDIGGAIMYDGKRMRKAIHRKTVDYNPSVFKYLQNRIWQRDRRDEYQIQPDSLYSTDLIPPSAMLEHPMNCVTTRFVRTSTNKFRCPIFCLTWTPEGRRLVTGASSGEFTLWNGLTFNFETILQAHETAVRAMRWSHTDAWMVTADHAGYIKYWQSNMNNVKMYQAHKEPVRGISFCPSDSKFASCSDDGTVRIWDFMRCHEERILRGHGADVRCVDWHPQKALLASGSKDNQQPVKLWDPRTGNSLATLHAHKHTVMDLKWHQNGNWMLTASRDHLVKLFDIRNFKEEMQTFKGHKREATAISWHPIHEGLFASGSADGALMFWMVGCDHEVGGMEEAHEGMVWSLAWHPLGHILASGSNDHATKFWTRNRPGDEMRDKYNLNNLPQGMMEQEILDYNQEPSAMPSLPGMGLEHGLPEHLQVKEEPADSSLPTIPGLDWEADEAFLKAAGDKSNKKVPYARPVPKMFEAAWSGEIDIDAIKKEQQKPKMIPPTPSNIMLAQQVLGQMIAGTLRQTLGVSEGGRMLIPGAPILMRPAAPRMIIAPGQPVMGPPQGQMLLIPGSGPHSMVPGGPAMRQGGDNNDSGQPQGQAGGDKDNRGSQSQIVGPQGQMGGPQGQMGGPQGQMGGPQGQMGGPQGQMGGPQGQMGGPQSQMGGPQGQMGGPQGQMGGPQGQMGGPQSQMGGPHGQMGGPQGQMGGPQGQMGPQEQMGGPQAPGQQQQMNGPPRPMGPAQRPMRPPGPGDGPPNQQMGPRPNQPGPPHPQNSQMGPRPPLPQNSQMGPRPGGPHNQQMGHRLQGPPEQGQFGPGLNQGPNQPKNRGRPQDMDDRFQGQGPLQRGGPNEDRDQDYRRFNGPVDQNTEDQDFRQAPHRSEQGPMRPNQAPRGSFTGHSRGRMPGNQRDHGGQDFQSVGGGGNARYRGRGRGGYGDRGGGEGYNNGGGNGEDEYGDYDERGEYSEQGDMEDFDYRVPGRGYPPRGRGGYAGGHYEPQGGYEEGEWGGEEEEGYDEEYGDYYGDQEGWDSRGGPGRKRSWEDGPGGSAGPRGRGGRGRPSMRREDGGDGPRGRGSFRGIRGGSGFRRGGARNSGWGRGAVRGGRGQRGY